MKLAIVTPYVQGSSIGRGSRLIAHELARRGHEITIVASETEDAPAEQRLPLDFPLIHWSRLDLAAARETFDLALVNVGNYLAFHRQIFPILAALPAIGLFHDIYGYNLFRDWVTERELDGPEHDRIVTSLYGPAVGDLASQAWRHEVTEGPIAERMPMIEWIATQCVGAVAHAEFYRKRLASACPGPVAAAPLAWPAREVAPPADPEPGRLTVSIFGILNRNKCADAVIEAIASSALLRQRVRLDLVGAIAPAERERLEALARGLVEVVFQGEVDDASYQARLGASDIVCCLRRPMLEGASATAIEGLQAGRPVVVADGGFYAEIPDGLAVKLPVDFTSGQVGRELERLAGDRGLRLSMGRRAAAWARARFTAEAYVDVLERLLPKAAALAPHARRRSLLVMSLAEMGVPAEMAVRLKTPRRLAAIAARSGMAGARFAKGSSTVLATMLRTLSPPYVAPPPGPPPAPLVHRAVHRFATRSPTWIRPGLRLAWRAGVMVQRRLRPGPQSAQ